MPFFEWSQVEPDEGFNDGLAHNVIIEGTLEEVENKALEMGIYYGGIECWQGGRLYEFIGEVDIPIDGCKLTIEEYVQRSVNNIWESPDARIFYKDGTVKEFFQQKESK